MAHGVPGECAPVTGAVMMDFLRPEFKGYFKTKAALCREFGLDAQKKLFLYISSFGYGSMSDEEVAELSKMAGKTLRSLHAPTAPAWRRRWSGSTGISPFTRR